MSGRRRRSESSWDRERDRDRERKEESEMSGGKLNSEANDAFDFSLQNMPMDPAFDDWDNQYSSRPYNNTFYRGSAGNMSKDGDQSRSPHRSKGRDRDRDRDRGSTRGWERSRSRSRGRDSGRGRSPINDERREKSYESADVRNDSRLSSRPARNRLENNDLSEKWNRPPEYTSGGGSRFRDDQNSSDDRPRTKGPDAYRKDRSQITKTPCRFFLMGSCNRHHCKFSHDVPKSGGYDSNLESGGFDQMPREHNNNNIIPEVSGSVDMVIDNSSGAYELTGQQFRPYDNMTPNFANGAEKDSDLFPNGQSNGSSGQRELEKPTEVQSQQGEKPLEAPKPEIPTQNIILANALELLYSLPNPTAPVDSKVVNDSTKAAPPESQTSVKPVENMENNPKGEEENTNTNTKTVTDTNPGKSETQGKGEEGNIGNDEKAMRQFKVALVEFVKDVLKPTWKEGKMSREVYKTIVKKVVDKVTSTIQGVQIPRTQEKIDQYLAFSKSKITKLVEAYVGRFLKAA